jgi:hypothetical protein
MICLSDQVDTEPPVESRPEVTLIALGDRSDGDLPKLIAPGDRSGRSAGGRRAVGGRSAAGGRRAGGKQVREHLFSFRGVG